MPIFIILVSLVLSIPAWADDLGRAGALSGMSQGMGRGFDQMDGLQEQRLERQPDEQAKAPRRTQQMAEVEAQRLNDEAQAIKQEKESLRAQSVSLMALQNTDPTRYAQEIVTHNEQTEGHLRHVENYNERVSSFNKKYGLEPPPTPAQSASHQHELRLQSQRERQQQQTSELTQLNEEKQKLDDGRATINMFHTHILRNKEANPDWEDDARQYDKLVNDFNKRLESYTSRVNKYNQRWDFTPAQTTAR